MYLDGTVKKSLTAKWLNLELYRTILYPFSPEYQNIAILFWKYLVCIRSEAWLNLVWEYINGKLFAVQT
jgi:hypothetical protein